MKRQYPGEQGSVLVKRFPWKKTFSLRYHAWLLQGLQRVSFWSDKFKQRLSPWGLATIAALLLTLVFGANIKLSSIYQLFALLLALLVLALFTVWFKSFRKVKHGLTIHRKLPALATVGVKSRYMIHIQANTQVSEFMIEERLPTPRIELAQFLNAKEPHEEKRNWYDRHTGYYRLLWLTSRLHGIEVSKHKVKSLQADERISCAVDFMPLRRGYIHLPKLRLRFPEPLGLAYNFSDIEVFDRILILPKAYRLPTDFVWGGQRKFQQGGVAQASHIGDSEEFSHLREYRDGDSLRHIFWASLARLQTPWVKTYQDEYFSRAALILDNDVPQHQELFEEAVSVAAGFAMAEHSQDMLLDLLFVGEQNKAEHMLTGRAIAHNIQMLETLATVAIETGSFPSLSTSVLQQAKAMNGCVLILTTWDEPRQAFVHQLQALAIPLMVLLVCVEDDVIAHKPWLRSLRVGHIQADLDALGTWL
ncbi:MAG: DUF58 domain-containing protein [Ghiorsea sp.]|nr:DUF58 domain-containing protein [Ghiorsea sp.]